MKNFALSILLLVPLCSFAQKELKLGINAGATFSSIRDSHRNYGFDYLAGITAEKGLNRHFAVTAGINYARLSFTDENDALLENGTTALDTKLTLQYLSIPVSLKLYIGKRKNLFVSGGIFGGYFLGTKFKSEQDKIAQTYPNNAFKDFDFGANAAIGYLISVNPKNDISIELRENLGLVPISDQRVMNNEVVKTSSLNLILSWQFNL